MKIGDITFRTIKIGTDRYFNLGSKIARAVVRGKATIIAELDKVNASGNGQIQLAYDRDCLYLVQDTNDFDLLLCDDLDFFNLTDYIDNKVLDTEKLVDDIMFRIDEITEE